VLAVAAIVAVVIQDYIDAGIIFFLIVLNIIVGFLQEFRAEKTLQKLRDLSAPTCTVIRDGDVSDLPTERLVPGDIVVVGQGDKIPADLRLFDIVDLECDEAILTGESVPVEKKDVALPDPDTPLGDRVNCAFAGTATSKGRAKGIVFATGTGTEIGSIAKSLSKAEKGKTPLQKRLDRLGQVLVVFAALAVVIVLLTGWAWGTFDDVWDDGLSVAVSAAVAIIPESLIPVLTLTLTIGVRRLAQKNAIVRKLAAIESLGNVEHICSDKTGTLTQGKMTVTAMYVSPDGRYAVTGEGFDPEKLRVEKEGKAVDDLQMEANLRMPLLICSLCNSAGLSRQEDQWIPSGSPTEAALLVLAYRGGLPPSALGHVYETVREFPFNSTVKRASVLCRDRATGKLLLLLKGAPDAVIRLCSRYMVNADKEEPIAEERIEAVRAANRMLGGEGLRVLALAFSRLPSDFNIEASREECEKDVCFAALLGLQDPPREGVPPALQACKRAGIKVHMLTGDHPSTATAIARQVGLLPAEGELAAGDVMPAPEFDRAPDEELLAKDHLPVVIARCSPESKVKMVRLLHALHRHVAMTGDGVNDAPAIAGADVGIAMGKTGSDVTKEAADIILLDDAFETIVVAVEEGRRIFANIRKYIIFYLAGNVAEGFVMVAGVAFGLGPPLIPIQILWTNLITGTPPAMALSVQPATPDLMDAEHRPPSERLFNLETIVDLFVYGLMMGVGDLVLCSSYADTYSTRTSGSARRPPSRASSCCCPSTLTTACISAAASSLPAYSGRARYGTCTEQWP
jgi:potassium/sodium efflux P-type ATPase